MTDPARSQVILVTLPETTPVNEAVETAAALKEEARLHLGPIVVNAFDGGSDLPAAKAPADSPLRAAAEFRNARRALHRREVARLAESLDRPQLRLPIMTSAAMDSEAVNVLAAGLEEQR